MKPNIAKKVSVERVNGTSIALEVAMLLRSIVVLTVLVDVGITNCWSSIIKREIRIMLIPNPKIVHFQIFLRHTPGSIIPLINPIIGKMKRIYLTSSGRLNSVRVTFHPSAMTTKSKSANTVRVMRIVLSVGFWAILEMKFNIKKKLLTFTGESGKACG